MKYKKTVIADGGIRSPGDLVKALLAGASAVMTGKLLASSKESAAPIENRGGEIFRKFFGSASFEAQIRGKNRGMLNGIRRPEGVTTYLPEGGPMHEVIDDLLDGLRSAMSYVGARSVADLRDLKDIFVLQTRAGCVEGVKK
jgi:IMP dehydrogenase